MIRLRPRREPTATRRQRNREAAYFDGGVSHGFAAAANELRAEQPAIVWPAWLLMKQALSAHIPRDDATAAAVIWAWSLLGEACDASVA